ncbi:hypothetical protein TgHK011_008766 [Trichoderma gracile]|nr:hypothetical protein TgHK011_008766 [Trichoderma gracile]
MDKSGLIFRPLTTCVERISARPYHHTSPAATSKRLTRCRFRLQRPEGGFRRQGFQNGPLSPQMLPPKRAPGRASIRRR